VYIHILYVVYKHGAHIRVWTPFTGRIYLGMEAVPLAAEDALDPRHTIPQALPPAIAINTGVTLLLVIIGSSMPPGLGHLRKDRFPMAPALEHIFHNHSGILDLVAVPGLFVALHGTVFAYSRVLFSLARAGLIPWCFAWTTARGAPWAAIALGGVCGCVIGMLTLLEGHTEYYEAVVTNMILIAGLLHVASIIAAFVLLRIKNAHVSGWPGVPNLQ
jgi:ethanolamine permease